MTFKRFCKSSISNENCTVQWKTIYVINNFHHSQYKLNWGLSPYAYLVRFEFSPDPPALVISQRMSVLLKESVNPRNASVPRILQVLQSQSSVLCIGLLSLQSILCPNSLRVNEFTVPWVYVSEQIIKRFKPNTISHCITKF